MLVVLDLSSYGVVRDAAVMLNAKILEIDALNDDAATVTGLQRLWMKWKANSGRTTLGTNLSMLKSIATGVSASIIIMSSSAHRIANMRLSDCNF